MSEANGLEYTLWPTCRWRLAARSSGCLEGVPTRSIWKPDETRLLRSQPTSTSFARSVWPWCLVSIGAQEEGVFYLQYTFACDRAGGFILVRTPVPATDPEFPSLTPLIPAVNWQEREIQDWFGLTASGHPNPRRVALHDDFPDGVYPLRKDFDLFSKPQPLQGPRHLFRPVEGEGVFQVPVGPIHAGIIEPGHFRFSVAGEPVLYLQIRLFYTHKATEKLFEHKPLSQAVFLAESISGDSSFSHSTAVLSGD